jgi:opacity protein-like surface antigen
MIIASSLRRACLLGLGFAGLSSAHALVKFNDAHDEIFVTGQIGVGYDSNIFATAGGDGDTSYTGSLDFEYMRKAGMLGVNSSVGWDFGKFQEFSEEDFADPHLRTELTKDGGRTTGSLTLAAARETRAESSINLRTTSWEYDASLNFKYPVIERYSISGQLGWNDRDYRENNALFDLMSYTASADLFYVYNSQRDLLAGYRFRVTETTNDTTNYDHAFTVGSTGRILPKLNGTVRFGYQQRQSERRAAPDESFDSVTALASATWNINSRFKLTGTLARDFSTLATDIGVDATTASLDASYAFTARYLGFGGVGVGHSRFLGAQGGGRRDTYFTYNAGVAYTLNDHLKVTLTYLYFENWSSLAFSDYDRHTISLNLSSRW